MSQKLASVNDAWLIPRSCRVSQSSTTRPESRKGSGRSSAAWNTLNTTMLDPIPNASITAPRIVSDGLRRSPRNDCRTSAPMVSMPAPARTSRTASLTCSAPPNSSSASRRASNGSAPARIFSSSNICRYEPISASRSASTAFFGATLRQSVFSLRHNGMISLPRIKVYRARSP